MTPMEDSVSSQYTAVTIMDVLEVDLCARAILDHVPVGELVRSERVCRRWQAAVLNYLQTCHSLSFEGFRYIDNYRSYAVLTKSHRAIKTLPHNHSLTLVSKTLDKWGPYVMQVVTDIGEDGYLDIIASKCPNMQELEIELPFEDDRLPPSISQLKQLKHLDHVALYGVKCFSENNNSDEVLGDILPDNCAKIAIGYNADLTGSFLTHLKPNTLKSLSLHRCDSLRLADMLSATHNLQAVTCLLLTEIDIAVFNNIHLLLMKMPQLEELTLRCNIYSNPLSEESIRIFSELVNLKYLNLVWNFDLVNDSFLEALARGCKKLAFLDIRGSETTISARGVAALCRRSPAAVTTLHFVVDPLIDDDSLECEFWRIKQIPLYQELGRLGCVELTWEWFRAACRDPRGRKLSLQTTSGDTVAQTKNTNQELKLIIFSI